MKTRLFRQGRRPAYLIFSFLLATSLVGGCDAKSAAQQAREQAAREPVMSDVTKFREFSLTIYGYNYTDSGLGNFEVNGRGGGNLSVSSLSGGGGSSACCAALYTPLPPNHKVHVKWTRHANIWCEADVPFRGPVPSNAEYLEVHFYRDGHIEIAATPDASPPRLRLERLHENSRHTDPSLNVNNDDKFARCKDGY